LLLPIMWAWFWQSGLRAMERVPEANRLSSFLRDRARLDVSIRNDLRRSRDRLLLYLLINFSVEWTSYAVNPSLKP
jgi:hypothetical protein